MGGKPERKKEAPWVIEAMGGVIEGAWRVLESGKQFATPNQTL